MRDINVDREQRSLVGESLHCEHCGRKLQIGRIEWLELNFVTREWAEPGTAEWSDGEDSQGMFPVGITCAKKLLAGKER